MGGLIDFRTDAIVFEDAKSDSLETASSTPSPRNSARSLGIGARMTFPGTHGSELEAENSAFMIRQTSCSKDLVELSDGISLSALKRGDVEYPRMTENTIMMIETELQACCKVSQHEILDGTQTVDITNTRSGLSWSVLQNFESLSVDPKHVNVTNTSSPVNVYTELLVETQQQSTELHPPSASCAVNGRDGANFDETKRNNCNISVTESCRLLGFYGEKELLEKPADTCDHHGYDSAKVELDVRSMQENKKSLPEVGGRDDRKSTEAEVEAPSARLTGEGLGDDCRVTFRPRRSAIPVPVRTISCVNHHALAIEASMRMRQFRATSVRAPVDLAQSSRGDRRPRSSQHDVKCAVRRKTVII